MKKINKKNLVFLTVLTMCVLISGCGCGKKQEPDEESTKVIPITISPEATPTPAPEQVNTKAVAKNGTLTMVNLYLAEEETALDQDAEDETEKTDTEGTEDGSEE